MLSETLLDFGMKTFKMIVGPTWNFEQFSTVRFVSNLRCQICLTSRMAWRLVCLTHVGQQDSLCGAKSSNLGAEQNGLGLTLAQKMCLSKTSFVIQNKYTHERVSWVHCSTGPVVGISFTFSLLKFHFSRVLGLESKNINALWCLFSALVLVSINFGQGILKPQW